MNKLIQKEALKKLQKEMSKEAFKSTFMVDSGSFDLADNIDAVCESFSDAMANNSDKLFDIIDKLIDTKLQTATIIPVLVAPSSGGAVTGKITIKGT